MSNSVTKEKVGGPKSKFKLPDTYVLLTLFIFCAAILTYLLPAGTYEKIADSNAIDPNSFHFIDKTPVNPFHAVQAISLGLAQSASIIFTVFLVSGAFKIINDTGSIDSAIDALSVRLQKKVIILIPIIMIAMSILGYLGIIVNQTIVFIPIGLLIARKLKMDPLVGLSMMYLATYAGFIGSGLDPFTIVVAQNIADLPLLSGMFFRTVVFVIMLLAAIIFLMRYAQKVMDDPTKSLMGTDYEWAVEAHQTAEFSTKHKVILVALFFTFGFYVYGAQQLKWGMNELNTVCILLAIFSGVISGMSFEKMSHSFVDGCKMAVYSAILIGFATAISVVLSSGNIIHTIIYYCSLPLRHMSAYFSAMFIFAFNWVFNFFVPSGSGQAAVVMPILAPLSDVIGLSKQVTVSAYKYGDGITNLIIPTSGTLMGFIGLARVPYDKWLKFITPLIGIWTAIAAVACLIGVAIGF